MNPQDLIDTLNADVDQESTLRDGAPAGMPPEALELMALLGMIGGPVHRKVEMSEIVIGCRIVIDLSDFLTEDPEDAEVKLSDIDLSEASKTARFTVKAFISRKGDVTLKECLVRAIAGLHDVTDILQ